MCVIHYFHSANIDKPHPPFSLRPPSSPPRRVLPGLDRLSSHCPHHNQTYLRDKPTRKEVRVLISTLTKPFKIFTCNKNTFGFPIREGQLLPSKKLQGRQNIKNTHIDEAITESHTHTRKRTHTHYTHTQACKPFSPRNVVNRNQVTISTVQFPINTMS